MVVVAVVVVVVVVVMMMMVVVVMVVVAVVVLITQSGSWDWSIIHYLWICATKKICVQWTDGLID